MNITTIVTATRALAVLSLALAASRASAQACGTVQDLGNLSNGPCEVTAMSADGAVIIGTYYDYEQYIPYAFRWTEATGMHDISMPGGGTWATAISGDGGTIVGYGKNYLNLDRAFRWTEATGRQDLGTIGGSTANALAVSADGSVIVGYAANFDGHSHAFRWTSATGMQDLGTLGGSASEATAVSADGSVVVGWSLNVNGEERAFRWTTNEGLQDLAPQEPAATYFSATAVSASGNRIAGWNWPRAFLWTAEAGFQDLTPPESQHARPSSISADGSVVVGYRAGPAGDETFRWTTTESFQFIASPDVYQAIVRRSERVSANGSVVIGTSSGQTGDKAVRWTERGGTLPLFPGSVRRSRASAVSTNGEIIAGTFTNPSTNRVSAFRWIKNPADVNNDGFVNALDYDQFAEAFESGDPDADFNSDCFVNGIDYDQFAEAFEAGC